MSNSAPVTIGGSIGELQFTAAEREALVRHGDEGDENIVRRDVQSVNHQPANGCSDAPLVLQGPVRSEEDRDDHGVLTTLHVHESGMKVKPIRIMLGNDDETPPPGMPRPSTRERFKASAKARFCSRAKRPAGMWALKRHLNSPKCDGGNDRWAIRSRYAYYYFINTLVE